MGVSPAEVEREVKMSIFPPSCRAFSPRSHRIRAFFFFFKLEAHVKENPVSSVFQMTWYTFETSAYFGHKQQQQRKNEI